MKLHSTNYIDTFIEVADDCPVSCGEVPRSKGDKKSVAQMQYELIIKHPYQLTSDDILFQIYAERNNLEQSEYKKAREAFFSKGQACFRASPLAKRHGFGVHSDSDGNVAIYGRETNMYSKLVKNTKVKKVKAMRNSKNN